MFARQLIISPTGQEEGKLPGDAGEPAGVPASLGESPEDGGGGWCRRGGAGPAGAAVPLLHHEGPVHAHQPLPEVMGLRHPRPRPQAPQVNAWRPRELNTIMATM